MKKRIAICLLAFVLIMGCFSCGSKKNLDSGKLFSELKSSGVFFGELTAFELDILDYIYPSVSADDYDEALVYIHTASVDEFAVFKAKNDAKAASIKTAMENRVAAQRKAYGDYTLAGDSVSSNSKLDHAIIKTYGTYVVFCVAADYAKADTIVGKYLK